MKKKSWFLCFEWTGGLWLGEDLYSTVSQSGQTPRWVMRDGEEERRRRCWWWWGGAASWSSWWEHLWWHHHDGVWLICLIARERHWCLELDLYYAAEGQKTEQNQWWGRPNRRGEHLQSVMQGKNSQAVTVTTQSNKRQNKVMRRAVRGQ